MTLFLKACILLSSGLYWRRDGGSTFHAFEAALGISVDSKRQYAQGGRAGAGADDGRWKTAVCVELGLPRQDRAIGMLRDAKERCSAVCTCNRARRSYAGGIGGEGQLQADQPERSVLHTVKLLQGRFGGTHPGQKAILHGRPNESLIKAQLTNHVQERRQFLEKCILWFAVDAILRRCDRKESWRSNGTPWSLISSSSATGTLLS